MDRIMRIWKKYREQLSYLIFGVLTTAVNIVVYGALSFAGLSTGWANGVALAASILFAYVTNRLWVFESRASGMAAVREFMSFIACRVGTGLVDQAIMLLGVDWLGPQLVAAAHMKLWGMAVKVAANVIVIVLNYILSKLIIFRKK